jgi:hypothetical protein
MGDAMTHGKLSIGAVLLAASLAGACSSSAKPGTPGTAGTSGSAGTTGAAGAAGASGSGGTTGNAGSGAAGHAGAGAGGAAGTVALVTPTEVVTAMGCGNIRLVLSGGKIYYTNKNAGTVNSVAVTGGTPTPIAMNQNKPNPIAVDGTNVYWGNDGDKTVMKQALTAGATAMTLVPASTDPDPTPDPNTLNAAHALLVSGATLYIGRAYDTYKIATSGGALTHLSHSPTENLGIPGALALDGTYLYETEIAHNAITREIVDGTQNGLLQDGVTHQLLAPDRIAVSRANLVTDAIEISGQYVVWANGTNIESHDKTKTQFEGATLNVLANSAEFSSLSGFVITGSKIYMGEADSSEVEVVALNLTPGDAGTPVANVIVKNQANPAEFAADDTSVYYTTITKADATGVCKIMKIAK